VQSLAKILLPVDFSERSLGAARYAKALAHHFQSEITLLHALPPPHYEFGPLEAGVLSELYTNRAPQAEKDLESFLRDELAGCLTKRIVLEGDPALRIVEYAHSNQTGLIVMPTHGYGTFRRFILGSNTAKVLHDADCPVWTGVHIQEHQPGEIALRQILCAVDLGPQTSRTLAWAAGMGREFGARLWVIHATPGVDASGKAQVEASVREEIGRVGQTAGVEPEVLIEPGDPAKVVCQAAARLQVDLLVIGRGSAGGVFGRLRTNAYAIIRQSPCPVASV
jgi:nucleotide-binding universal stress UspA family protein